jgi:sugar phosphate isomerase/epimerase
MEGTHPALTVTSRFTVRYGHRHQEDSLLQVAVTTRVFHDLSFAEACQQVTDLEFDKIELCFSENGKDWSIEQIAQDPEQFAANYRELTRLTPVAIYLRHDIEREAFKRLCRFAKLLKVTQITIPSSPVGAPYNTEVDRLKDFVALATQEGIRVSIKTESGMLTQDPHTAVELCQAVKSLGITLDPSYYLCHPSGKSLDYDLLIPYVYHVHLRDSSESDLQVLTGLGHIDYNRLIAQLENERFNRTLSVDLLPEKTPVENRELELRKLRLLMESLL